MNGHGSLAELERVSDVTVAVSFGSECEHTVLSRGGEDWLLHKGCFLLDLIVQPPRPGVQQRPGAFELQGRGRRTALTAVGSSKR